MKKRSLLPLEENLISLRDYEKGGDNSEDIDAMKKFLALAIKNELTDKQKDCIIRHYFYGQSFTEIGEEFGVYTSTVRFHVRQGLKKIRRSSVYINVIKDRHTE